jgi:hypothetical protein
MISFRGTFISIVGETSIMSSHTVGIEKNTPYTKMPSENSLWSTKYNRSLDEIQQLFNSCGNSIARTIEILRNEIGSVNRAAVITGGTENAL